MAVDVDGWVTGEVQSNIPGGGKQGIGGIAGRRERPGGRMPGSESEQANHERKIWMTNGGLAKSPSGQAGPRQLIVILHWPRLYSS